MGVFRLVTVHAFSVWVWSQHWGQRYLNQMWSQCLHMAHAEMCQSCRISPGIQSWKMLLCPLYCSVIAFNPIRLQHLLGTAGMLFPFSPMMDLFLAGWQGHGHIRVLVCIPLDISFLKFLVWMVDWDGGVSTPCTLLPSSLWGIAHITLHFSSSHIFSFLSSCVHQYPLYAQPCSLCIKSISFWQ